eukprot:PITA_16440
MANCMLQSKGISLNFWAEAIDCANYIVNHTPTKILKNITPEEAWSSIKPNDAAGALVGDPTDQRCICSQFDRASSLLAQASTNYDPDTFAEDLGYPDWDTTMNDEYHSLLVNDTWDLVPLLKGRKLIRWKWGYRTKFGPNGKVDKHKSCLVAKVFSQVEGIDYTETFSPISKMNSIRLVLSLAASFKW